ncbi:uncharacterized protein PAC_15074 [Phialocephala subalpina]|uniref:Uncharacterized protein n=1 Tax=Phialocephala subalpina TaxID=576137 RepID=A0A1L7XJI2_9HELO|nr:uncharacterized protein PAC_15074 [Phialocephala subalpina]
MTCHKEYLPDGTYIYSCGPSMKSESLSGSETTDVALNTPPETNICGEVEGYYEGDAELRELKIEHLLLEERMIKGEQDIREGASTKMESGEKKLSKLKMMASMGLAAPIISGFQSLDVSIHEIVQYYMSVVIPHNQLGLEIAFKEGKEMDIQGYKTALARIQFEMQEHVQARLEQSKREIVQKCEERALELMDLAAADL